MLRKPLLMLLCALVLAAAFCYGVGRLFVLRYERGDDYPPYSTLRTDALGTRGIYEALDQLPGLDVERNFRPLSRLKPETPITLVYPGMASTAKWRDRNLQHFQSLVVSGSRAVITFVPISRKPSTDEPKSAEAEEPGKSDEKKPENAPDANLPAKDNDKVEDADEKADEKKTDKDDADENDDEDDSRRIALTDFADATKRWGVAFDFLPVDKDRKEDAPRIAMLADQKADLDPEIPWRSVICFKDLAPEWRVLYRCEDRPVIIERNYGRGSMVLAADSFFLTNEALRGDRHPRLLARLFDGPAMLVFDEDHHGVKERPGVASLTRKYRLHGVVFGLLLIAVLFVWKNAVRFIPAYPDDTRDGEIVAGKESAEGFVNLLRRTIKPAEIIALCGAEWRKSTTHRGSEHVRVEEILLEDEARPPRERNPVATYQTIAQTLTRH